MLKVIGVILSLFFAFLVLFISILRAAEPRRTFSPMINGQTQYFVSQIKYYFPSPGIEPDSIFWPLKVSRDRIWLFITRDHIQRAGLLLLFADKRIVMARDLAGRGEISLSVSTANKAEQYLSDALDEEGQAEKKNEDVAPFLEKLSIASLKHKETLKQIMSIAPEDARPVINQILDLPRRVYEKSSQDLNARGLPVSTVSPVQK